jgi:hypothetical protein
MAAHRKVRAIDLQRDPGGRDGLVFVAQPFGEGEDIFLVARIELVREEQGGQVLPDAIGRALPINVNGAIPAVMLDAGFPLAALKGISLLARTASLIAHLQEETERPIGFIMSGAAAERIGFDDGTA